jgi:hypothetical protein
MIDLHAKTLADLFATAGDAPTDKGRGQTAHESRGDTKSDQTTAGPSTPVSRPLILVPISLDGEPDWDNRILSDSFQTSPRGSVMLRWDGSPGMKTMALMALVQEEDGSLRAAGLQVHSERTLPTGGVQARGRPGGYAGALLRPENLMPTFQPTVMEFQLGFPEELLDKWATIGVLEKVWLDRVQVCPKCHGLPTFRQGCCNCGSARIENDRLIHHFACAHVGMVRDFEAGGELVCPKCRTRPLVVGSDYEYQVGPYRCQECHWCATELEAIGQCLRCHLRFPSHQADEVELKGYRVQRLDLLALTQTS